MNIAIVRLYAATTHWMPDSPAPKSCWMSGMATFTIIASTKIMNNPRPVATSVHVARLGAAPRDVTSVVTGVLSPAQRDDDRSRVGIGGGAVRRDEHTERATLTATKREHRRFVVRVAHTFET